jgi:hypothetical protein
LSSTFHADKPNRTEGLCKILIISSILLIVFLSSLLASALVVHTTDVSLNDGMFTAQHATLITETTAIASSSSLTPLFWYVGASAIYNGSNSGVRSLIQVENQDSPGVLSFWISEAFVNNFWAQVGYYVQNGSEPIGFYQVWSLDNRSEIATGTTSVSDGFHMFGIAHLDGTTWKFTLDSKIFGSFDMRTNRTNPEYPLYAMSEEGYVKNPFSFSEVIFSKAIQILESGRWVDASSAVSYGNAWGITGTKQSAELSTNEVLLGGALNALPANAELW